MPTPTRISAAQIKVYVDFDGDEDMYQRRGMPQHKTLGDIWGAWSTIEDLRRRFYLAAAGLASEHFSAMVEADLSAWATDDETRQKLLALGDQDVREKKQNSVSHQCP